MTYQVTRFLMFVVSISILVRISIPYLLMFLNFMFNQKYERYDKRVEKPRLLFHIIGFIIMALAIFPLKEYANIISYNKEIFLFGVPADVLLLGASLVVFLLGVAVSLFSWSHIFKDKYIPKIEQALDDNNELNFKKDINIEDINDKLLLKWDKKDLVFDEFPITSLKMFVNGDNSRGKTNWIFKAQNHDVNTMALFDFLHEVIEGGINPLVGEKRRKLIDLICDNFKKDGENFEYKNLNPGYSTWLGVQNRKKQVE